MPMPLFLLLLLLAVAKSVAAHDATSSPLFTGDTIASSIDDASLHHILIRARQDDQPDAMYALAMLQFYGRRVDRDVGSAMRLLTRLAQHHRHPDAQFTLGVLLTSGLDGVVRDDLRGAAWLAASAANGHVDAPWVLAGLYNDGRGVARDPHRAFALLKEANAHTNPHARAVFQLGVMYEYGHGGAARDVVKAAELYRRASERNVIEATYYLALLHAAGRGVPMNMPRARQLLTRVAEQGHAAAWLRLGEMHAIGEGGIAIDYASALNCFQRAVVSGAGTHVANLAQQRVTELQQVLDDAEARIRDHERVLGVPLQVEIATIEGR